MPVATWIMVLPRGARRGWWCPAGSAGRSAAAPCAHAAVQQQNGALGQLGSSALTALDTRRASVTSSSSLCARCSGSLVSCDKRDASGSITFTAQKAAALVAIPVHRGPADTAGEPQLSERAATKNGYFHSVSRNTGIPLNYRELTIGFMAARSAIPACVQQILSEAAKRLSCSASKSPKLLGTHSGGRSMPSFDIVSEIDMQEVRNAVENATAIRHPLGFSQRAGQL